MLCNQNKFISLHHRNKQIEIMTTQNTTSAQQSKLAAFAKSLGITIENLERMYQDPIKASFLNVISQGL